LEGDRHRGHGVAVPRFAVLLDGRAAGVRVVAAGVLPGAVYHSVRGDASPRSGDGARWPSSRAAATRGDSPGDGDPRMELPPALRARRLRRPALAAVCGAPGTEAPRPLHGAAHHPHQSAVDAAPVRPPATP